MSNDVYSTADRALEEMVSVGFEQAQVSVTISDQDELNIMHNEPSLLRSTEDHALSLTGIVDGRKAVMALTDLSPGAMVDGVSELIERARLAPQDEANAVSEGEESHFEQGPLEGDMDLMALKVEELIDFRASHTPKMQIEEGAAVHRVARECLVTSGGTRLTCEVGCYQLQVFGAATDGDKTSSFNYTGGGTNALAGTHASDHFGIGEMMAETEQQIETSAISGNFVGDIILAPGAVMDLLGWLLGQIRDMSLIADTSLFKERVGEQIASDKLNVRSRFDGAGHVPWSADGFVAHPLTLLQDGRLNYLLPSLYGSLKTGIKHTPSSSGWSIDAGDTAKADMIEDIEQGAMVNRLSMGSPGPSGDFSGVIKNSFIITGGQMGQALSETMIAGNMASMLNDIVSLSSEHLDNGSHDFPWIRIANLNFS